jgi:hypothetical protein
MIPRTKNGDRARPNSTHESVSEIAASIAASLAKSREGRGTLSDDPPQTSAFVTKGDATIVNRRQFHGTASAQISPQVLPDQLNLTTVTSEEYRKRLETCLLWAREANPDSVRFACLTLAQAWLSAAMNDDGRARNSTHQNS